MEALRSKGQGNAHCSFQQSHSTGVILKSLQGSHYEFKSLGSQCHWPTAPEPGMLQGLPRNPHVCCLTTCLLGTGAEPWLPNFMQGLLRGRLSPTPHRGRFLRNLLPCVAEENVARGGADAELSADNQGHCLHPFFSPHNM